VGVIGALALVVVVCMLVPGSGEDRDKPTADAKAAEQSAKSGDSKPMPPGPSLDIPVEMKDGIGRLGDPDSPVKVDVYIPGHGGCGNETASFAYRVYKANKEKMQVAFVDFESTGGSKYQGDAGLHCSGVAINGKQKYDVSAGSGEARTVELTSNLGDRWNETEFLMALDVAFRDAYGKPANHKLPSAKTAGSGTPPGASPKAPMGKAKQ